MKKNTHRKITRFTAFALFLLCGLSVGREYLIGIHFSLNSNPTFLSPPHLDTISNNYTSSILGRPPGTLNHPSGVAVDTAGNIYVTDYTNDRVYKFYPNGTLITYWGSPGSGNGQFNSPRGVAVDGSGRIYVADTNNNRIQIFDSTFQYFSQWAVTSPSDLAINQSTGNLYVTKAGTNTVGLYTSSGAAISSTFDSVSLNSPLGIAINNTGYVYVIEQNNYDVKVFDGSGVFQYSFGSQGFNPGQFYFPFTLAISGSGNVYVSDLYNGISNFTNAGNIVNRFAVNVPGPDPGQFNQPWGLALNSSGYFYIADFYNSRGQCFNPSGVFQFVFPTGAIDSSQFSYPQGIAINSTGFIYVLANDRVVIFNSAYQYVNSWGTHGTGTNQLDLASGIAINNSGAVYIGNRAVNKGKIFDSVGNYLSSWFLNQPLGIAINDTGSIYEADIGSDDINAYTQTGTLLNSWGSVGTGDNHFNRPTGIAIDQASGNVYVTDQTNNNVQLFSPSGQFEKNWGVSGTGNSQFNAPSGVALDSYGNVYVADTSNYRVQVFTAAGDFTDSWGTQGSGPSQFLQINEIALNPQNYAFVSDLINNSIQVFQPSIGSPGQQTALTLSSPADVEYEAGTTGHSINWTVQASIVNNPTYQIYRNGTEVNNGTWTPGGMISIQVDDLDVGKYNFTAVANDGLGGSTSDEVDVLVTPAGNSSNLFIWIAIIGAIAIGFFALFLHFRRKQNVSKN